MRFLLHDVRHVLFLRTDMISSSDIQIHSTHNFCSNNILCLIFHLIFSLYLFEDGKYDSSYVVCDLGNYDSSYVVCDLGNYDSSYVVSDLGNYDYASVVYDLHLSGGYLDFSLFHGDLFLFLCLSLY
jgi:hypothetical protein